MCFFLKSIDC
jgi:hypothetical protein